MTVAGPPPSPVSTTSAVGAVHHAWPIETMNEQTHGPKKIHPLNKQQVEDQESGDRGKSQGAVACAELRPAR